MLDLGYNNLTSVPVELGDLASLETLDLSGNELESVPAAWERGGSLEQSGCMILR